MMIQENLGLILTNAVWRIAIMNNANLWGCEYEKKSQSTYW